MLIQNLIACSILILTFISALSDISTAKLRNEIFIAGVVLGLTMNAALNGWHGVGFSLLGLLIPILVFLPLSSNHFNLFGFHGIKIIGMGDLKLFGYVGALVCFPNVFTIIFLTYIIGGVFSLFLMIRKKMLISRITYFFSWLIGYIKGGGKKEYVSAEQIKFAPFVFFAACAYYLYQWVF